MIAIVVGSMLIVVSVTTFHLKWPDIAEKWLWTKLKNLWCKPKTFHNVDPSTNIGNVGGIKPINIGGTQNFTIDNSVNMVPTISTMQNPISSSIMTTLSDDARLIIDLLGKSSSFGSGKSFRIHWEEFGLSWERFDTARTELINNHMIKSITLGSITWEVTPEGYYYVSTLLPKESRKRNAKLAIVKTLVRAIVIDLDFNKMKPRGRYLVPDIAGTKEALEEMRDTDDTIMEFERYAGNCTQYQVSIRLDDFQQRYENDIATERKNRA